MQENKQIYFRKNAVSTFEDFIDRWATLDNFTNCKYMNDILLAERILFQNQKILPNGVENKYYSYDVPSRAYSFTDMVLAQNMLELLDLLETLKYRNIITNARSIQRNFLYSGFNMDNNLNFPTSIKEELSIDLSENIKLGNYSIKVSSPDMILDGPKSIRDYFANYLKYRSVLSKAQSLPYTIMQSEQRTDSIKANREHQPHYYLPTNDIPEFLLSFKFNDGRDFSSWGKYERLPRFAPTRNRSETSYKTVLCDIQRLYPNSDSTSASVISHRHRMDFMFFHNKLSRIQYYYKLYTQEVFLNQFLQAYTLTYKEVLNLELYFINNIFGDITFMKSILSSPYLDGFLLFDIQLQANLFLISLNYGSKTLKTFLDNINTWKQQVCSIINNSFWIYDFSNELAKTDNSLNIDLFEKAIVKKLQDNSFFKKYYKEENTFIPLYLNSSAELPLPFGDIRTIVSE